MYVLQGLPHATVLFQGMTGFFRTELRLLHNKVNASLPKFVIGKLHVNHKSALYVTERIKVVVVIMLESVSEQSQLLNVYFHE